MTIKELEKKALEIRLSTLKTIHKANSGYVGASMSVVEILVALYHGNIGQEKVMDFDVNKPGWNSQDYFVLSKISVTPVYYAVLADLGFFDKEELNYLGQTGSILKNTPNAKVPGVSIAVSKFARGLSMALGLALSLKMERRENRVFCLIEDDELQKGQMWEAINMVAHFKLDNLLVIVERPFTAIDSDKPGGVKIDQLQDKFEAFGWKVVQVIDGHDFDDLLNGFVKAFNVSRKPVCILCNTISGKGIEFAERKHAYLNANLSHAEMADIVPKLEVNL